MPRIELAMLVDAPIERCFDLARSIDLHVVSAAATSERAVAGVTAGLIGLGQEVTWEARHFGIRQRLTSRITAYDRPFHFRDSQVRGAFRRFDHDHRFERVGDRTRMVDVFDFDAPYGVFGRIVARVALTGYMRRFLRTRLEVIKSMAESPDWRRYVPPAGSRDSAVERREGASW